MSAGQAPTIDLLLRLVPDAPHAVLQHLERNPSSASQADSNGYSLLHAAASYNQLDLLRALVKTYGVNPNEIKDSDGETPLFAAETVAVAKCLVEELGADLSITNDEGTTALENARDYVEDGSEWLAVAEYLANAKEGNATSDGGTTSDGVSQTIRATGDNNETQHMPPLPQGVSITGMRTVADDETNIPEADPEFRRRIEELAAREDFQGEEGQRELRRLVEDAVGGIRQEDGTTADIGRDVRRRLD